MRAYLDTEVFVNHVCDLPPSTKSVVFLSLCACGFDGAEFLEPTCQRSTTMIAHESLWVSAPSLG